MTTSQTLTRPDGRTVGYVDYGPAEGFPVVWCHGGPGSRLEPSQAASQAAAAGLRPIGIDRPGYGLSTPQPGRSIAGWVPDALAVLAALSVDRFAAAGVSTGGAYTLALAALVPERVRAVVACCALTDMRWPEGRQMMDNPAAKGLWDAPDREHALAAAAATFGEDGSKMFGDPDVAPNLAPADMALFSDPEWLAAMGESMREMFACGVQGYTDDRLADGVGWVSFDVRSVRCPVLVLHGALDTIVPVAQARHTASIVPDAGLRVVDDQGHLSIVTEVPGAAAALLAG
jgi:pimeloyl-ACP methyl ester carboxylesterase